MRINAYKIRKLNDDNFSYMHCTIYIDVIQAEGVPQEYNQAVLIDLRGDNNHFTTDFSIAFPEGTVDGSERIVVSVIGKPRLPFGWRTINIFDIIWVYCHI